MYKLLLCLRYLRTRYLAVISVISVMLGVATLIVVNSVMSGFSTKLRDRLHGVMSDVVIECPSYNGFPLHTDVMLERIRESSVGGEIAAITPTIEVFAMLQYRYPNGEGVTRPVHLIGVDAKGRSDVGGFSEHLTDPRLRADPTFALTPEARGRFEALNPLPRTVEPMPKPLAEGELPPPEAPPSLPRDPKAIVIGFAIGTYRQPGATSNTANKDMVVLAPGDTVSLMTIGGGRENPEPVHSSFVVNDYIRTEMAEYDSQYVYVSLDYLQTLRAMDNRATHIQIRLKDFSKARKVVGELRKLFPSGLYNVQTWEDKQSTLLSAIEIERGILNILLFLIIGVAGFSILAIFSMIVIEKTRDIGVMKSLGASNGGILAIFVGYGLLLGVVGCGMGTILGLTLTTNINEIEQWLSAITGQDVFNRDVYYFDKIPTNIQASNVTWINVGAILIAVVFSILPAIRAAWIQPVRALRFE